MGTAGLGVRGASPGSGHGGNKATQVEGSGLDGKEVWGEAAGGRARRAAGGGGCPGGLGGRRGRAAWSSPLVPEEHCPPTSDLIPNPHPGPVWRLRPLGACLLPVGISQPPKSLTESRDDCQVSLSPRPRARRTSAGRVAAVGAGSSQTSCSRSHRALLAPSRALVIGWPLPSFSFLCEFLIASTGFLRFGEAPESR